MVVVFVEEVPVCHPARDQLSDGFCDTYSKKERMAGVKILELEKDRTFKYLSQMGSYI